MIYVKYTILPSSPGVVSARSFESERIERERESEREVWSLNSWMSIARTHARPKFSVKETKQSHGQSSITARRLVKIAPFGLYASVIISVICQITFVCCQSVTASRQLRGVDGSYRALRFMTLWLPLVAQRRSAAHALPARTGWDGNYNQERKQ